MKELGIKSKIRIKRYKTYRGEERAQAGYITFGSRMAVQAKVLSKGS
jgi:hypothetical protein